MLFYIEHRIHCLSIKFIKGLCEYYSDLELFGEGQEFRRTCGFDLLVAHSLASHIFNIIKILFFIN